MAWIASWAASGTGTPLRVRSLTSSMITAMTVFRLAGGFEPRVYVYASHEIVEEYRAHMAYQCKKAYLPRGAARVPGG